MFKFPNKILTKYFKLFLPCLNIYNQQRREEMRGLLFIFLLGLVWSRDTRPPEQIIPFELSYEDIEDVKSPMGQVLVSFEVSEEGKVVNAKIIDGFDIKVNSVVLDKVVGMKFNPAVQNGYPIRVRYHLPIVFK